MGPCFLASNVLLSSMGEKEGFLAFLSNQVRVEDAGDTKDAVRTCRSARGHGRLANSLGTCGCQERAELIVQADIARLGLCLHMEPNGRRHHTSNGSLLP